MLEFSEGTDDGRQPTRNHGYDVIVGGRLFTDYPDHLRQRIYIPCISDWSTGSGPLSASVQILRCLQAAA